MQPSETGFKELCEPLRTGRQMGARATIAFQQIEASLYPFEAFKLLMVPFVGCEDKNE